MFAVKPKQTIMVGDINNSALVLYDSQVIGVRLVVVL